MESHNEDGMPGIAVNPGNREVIGLRKWQRPEIADLPRLSELTLQSGGGQIPGGGGTGGGGSTVVP